jgi:hypothetical protein
VTPPATPFLGPVEQHISDGLVSHGLEEPEKPNPVVVGLIVQAVADGRDPPDHLAISFGQEVLGIGMLKERVLVAGKQQCDVPTQRRDPNRVPPVKSIGKINELLKRPAVSDGPDRYGLSQMTPSSRPIRAKVSRQ